MFAFRKFHGCFLYCFSLFRMVIRQRFFLLPDNQRFLSLVKISASFKGLINSNIERASNTLEFFWFSIFILNAVIVMWWRGVMVSLGQLSTINIQGLGRMTDSVVVSMAGWSHQGIAWIFIFNHGVFICDMRGLKIKYLN